MSQLIASPTIGGTTLQGVTVDNQTVFGNGLDVPLFSKSNSNNSLVSGGASWSGTGYVFDVSALTFLFDGVIMGPTTPTQVTLTTADPTNDRFDAIVVDQAGTISKITGTASTNPVFPAIPATQLLVQYVYVTAGSITPTILQDLMYDENTGPTTEWTASQFDTTTGALGTVNVASTNAPYRGTKCIQATAVNARRGLRLVRQTTIDLQQFAYVQIWYRNDGVALPTAKVPYFQFQNSAGNPTGNNVNLLTYGVSRTIINTWQLVVVPVSAFGNLTTIKGARMLAIGGTLASTANFSIDFALLSGGILPQGNLGPIYLSPSNTLYSSGAGTGATSARGSIFLGQGAGFNAVNALWSMFVGENAGFGAINARDSIFLGKNAGYGAIAAQTSIFLGENSGSGAIDAGFSIFLGHEAGFGSTSTGLAVAIGYQASPDSYTNTIALGTLATNTASNQMMIGNTLSPINEVIINGTAGIQVPVGTTTDRIATQGMIRYNTTTSKFEGYDGSTWVDLN